MTQSTSAARRIFETVRDSGPLWTASLILDRIFPYGVLGLWSDRAVSAEALRAQLDALLRAWGMSAEHAATTVEHVLYADLHGIDSHGCGMLLHYHRALLAGTVTMTPTITVVRESPATALVDGGGGLGHVPADTAMKLAVAKCRETGIGAVAVRNSGHYGAAGAYARIAVASGFIGVATTSTWSPTVVPTFGAEAKLGTNPIAFAAPAARHPPFVLDMATSAASIGKIMTAWRKGLRIPVGWALDAKGSPVTRARAATVQRRLTPLGGTPETGSYKGYGLAAVVEILSSVLSGHRPRGGDAQTDASAGHFFLAMDPQRFVGDGAFATDLDALVDSLHACTPLDASRPVLVPGDPEHAAYAERRHTGIPLSRNIVEDLRSVARRSGVPFTLDAVR